MDDAAPASPDVDVDGEIDQAEQCGDGTDESYVDRWRRLRKAEDAAKGQPEVLGDRRSLREDQRTRASVLRAENDGQPFLSRLPGEVRLLIYDLLPPTDFVFHTIDVRAPLKPDLTYGGTDEHDDENDFDFGKTMKIRDKWEGIVDEDADDPYIESELRAVSMPSSWSQILAIFKVCSLTYAEASPLSTGEITSAYTAAVRTFRPQSNSCSL